VQSGASPGNGRHVLPSKLVWVPISRLCSTLSPTDVVSKRMAALWRLRDDDATQQQPQILRPLHSAQGPQDDDLVDGFVPGGLTGSFSVVPQGLNPSQFWALFGMTATACGKIGRRRGDRPSAAEAGFLRSLYGTAEAVPLQN
jgi:hypothetical protein